LPNSGGISQRDQLETVPVDPIPKNSLLLVLSWY